MRVRRQDRLADAIDTAASTWLIRRDAGLSAEEEEEFQRWRSSSPQHAAAFAANEKAWSMLDLPRRAGKGEFLRREYRTRVTRRRQKRIVGAAVLFIIALTAGATMWRARQGVAMVAFTPSRTATVVAPARQTLADGSQVDLRIGAEIAVAFEPQIRRVSLQKGAAHFDVTSNPGRPFIVNAAGIEVFAVGTAFSVQLDAREIAVLVTEGRVAIDRLPVDSVPAAPVLVDAGHRLVVSLNNVSRKAQVLTVLTPAEIDEALSWRTTHLEFSDTPLAEAVSLLNRYSAPYGTTRLAIDDPTVAAVHVTGYFRADSLEAFVRLIGASAGIAAERVGDTITLRKPR